MQLVWQKVRLTQLLIFLMGDYKLHAYDTIKSGASKKRCNYSADKIGHILMHSCLDDAISSGVKF